RVDEHRFSCLLARDDEAVLVERCDRGGLDLHAHPFPGRDGRISSRLGRLRAGCFNRPITASATSSGDSFQESSPPRARFEKPVATDPGSTTLTRMPSPRTSCITDSVSAMSAAFDAQ